MVFDSIENAPRYFGLGKGIETVLKFFASYDPASHSTEQVVIDGENIYINRGSYRTAPNPDALFEAHREYIDVMFIADGEEKFFVKPLARLSEITTPYTPEMEACLGKIDSDAAAFRFPKGHFCIFFPEDAHCAGQLWEQPSDVKKLIAKVKLTAL